MGNESTIHIYYPLGGKCHFCEFRYKISRHIIERYCCRSKHITERYFFRSINSYRSINSLSRQAELGKKYAQVALGMIYLFGDFNDVRAQRNPARGVAFLQAASKRGQSYSSIFAKEYLIKCYTYGYGVEKSEEMVNTLKEEIDQSEFTEGYLDCSNGEVLEMQQKMFEGGTSDQNQGFCQIL